MNFLEKKPIERHGVSTEEKPLPKIPVNTTYEHEPEDCDDIGLSGAGDPFAPSPYQLSVFDNHIDIYSGDGRIIATLMRDNFASISEFIYTARLFAASYSYADIASYAMSYVNMLRAGSPSSFPEKYTDKCKQLTETNQSVYYGSISGCSGKYEPVRYESKGYEQETEKAYKDEPRVPRDAMSNDAIIIVQDHDLPEVDEEVYRNGYA